MDPYAMPPEMRVKYEAQFTRLNPVGGFITGEQARGLFLQSSLPPPILAHIWQLADVDADGKMDINEFSIAFHLIALKLRGIEVPPTLPPNLRALVQSPFEAFKMQPVAPMMASQVPVGHPGPPGRPPPPPAGHPVMAAAPGRPPPPTSSAPPSQPASRSGSISVDWAIPMQARKKYSEQFSMVDSGRTGAITGVQVRGILMQSGLPQAALAQIWNLSDVNSDGKLMTEEFILAMFLVERTRAGAPLPPVLPAELVPPSFRTVAVSAYSQAPPRPAMPPAPVLDQSMPRSVSSGSRVYSVPGSGAASPGQVITGEWAVPQVERLKATQQFNAIDVNRTGFLTGQQARNVLVQSALPQQILAQIWNLSDVDTDGKLSNEEFILAMYFIEQTKLGCPLPGVLPPELMPPSRRKGSLTGSVTNDEGQNSALTEWAIPQSSKLRHTQTFNSHDRARTGYINGNQARGILMQSGLPTDILAQVWNLSDIGSAGRLTCEEFVLAMHLIDMVRAGDIIPGVLPPDLIPPSHRRKRSVGGSFSSATGVTVASVNDSTLGEEPGSPLRKGSVTTFEDKRKENFDKGQAVLDRKRQVLLDAQKREQEERERKEREEQAKREKVRLEMERKRMEELEKQRQKQMEIEAEKEEARRQQLEQREAARREMERQRMVEWESQRTQELQIQKQKVLDALAQLKSRKKSIALEVEQVNNTYNQWKVQVKEGRDKVTAKKSEIDEMRGERDTLMKSMSLTNTQLRTLQDRQKQIEHEKLRIAQALKNLAAQAQSETEVTGDSAQFALQNKQMMLNQVKSQLEEIEKDKKQKERDLEVSNQQLNELKTSVETRCSKARELQQSYEIVLQKASQLKEALYQKQQHYDPDAEWAAEDTSGPASIMVTATETASVTTSGETVQYRAVYAFEARNSDELSLQPGDVIAVRVGVAGEPGWLQGDLNGQTGWFPEDYVETLDAGVASQDPFAASQAAFESAPTVATDAFASQAVVAEAPVADSVICTAVALYQFDATESDHLAFMENDTIVVKEQQDEWWRGEANGASGWFPKAYVRQVEDATDSASVTVAGDWHVAIYPFVSQEPGDLEFEANEVIKVTKKEGDWWTGEISASRMGIFPANYVRPAESIEIPQSSALESSVAFNFSKESSDVRSSTSTPSAFDSPARSAASPKPKKGTKGKKPEVVQVIANYNATGAEQLSLEKGQLVQVKKKNTSGWWEGEVQIKGIGKQTGWFPATYVKSLAGASPARSTPEVS
ncbi:Intersectin-2 [Halotydeus destructor]|nr:Intersectin-2 [Halotydeus destructor]